jgi:hypothetical protein
VGGQVLVPPFARAQALLYTCIGTSSVEGLVCTHALALQVCRGLSVEETRRLARENAKDIIACGFDVSRTFIFSDFEYVGGAFYR